MELDIKEMLELGKKASSIHMSSPVETDIVMQGNRYVERKKTAIHLCLFHSV